MLFFLRHMPFTKASPRHCILTWPTFWRIYPVARPSTKQQTSGFKFCVKVHVPETKPSKWHSSQVFQTMRSKNERKDVDVQLMTPTAPGGWGEGNIRRNCLKWNRKFKQKSMSNSSWYLLVPNNLYCARLFGVCLGNLMPVPTIFCDLVWDGFVCLQRIHVRLLSNLQLNLSSFVPVIDLFVKLLGCVSRHTNNKEHPKWPVLTHPLVPVELFSTKRWKR